MIIVKNNILVIPYALLRCLLFGICLAKNKFIKFAHAHQKKEVIQISKYSQKRYRNVGELSSKYAYDKDGKQFESDIQKHFDEAEKLYIRFKEFMKSEGVTPDKFRALFRRYYDEFIKE